MRVTSLVAALLVLAGVVYWFVLRHEVSSDAVVASVQPAAAEQVPVVAVQVIDSEARETQNVLILRGRTAANRLVEVAAQTTGRVISEPRPRGARVSEGDLLCRIDPATTEAELAEAEAGLAEAEAEAAAAESLSTKGYAAQTTLKTRRAALRAAQARLDKVRWEIKELEILAPFDGVLETDPAEFGAFLNLGEPCATVIDLSQVIVEGFVSEAEVDQLALGQPAMARLVNGMQAQGKITFLGRVADPETRTYAVEVTLANPSGRLRDGMTAELAIALPTARGHLIPESALTLDDAGRMGVRVDADGTVRFYPVTILLNGDGGIWVGGLPDTARIITVGQEFVRDGSLVEGVLAGAAE